MRKTLVVAALALVVVASAALPASAHHVGPHQHFVVTPTGAVEVGPRRCGNETVDQGFQNFHHNIHEGTPKAKAFAQENNPVAFAASPCPSP